MDRKQAVSTIEALFPIDSEYPKTNEVGRKLLLQALYDIGWRKLPDEILIRYADLCQQEENRQTREMLKSDLLKGW